MANKATPASETHYQVLGVRRNAHVTDITRAFARILADDKREDVPPNPKLLAAAKVAYETLSDPEKRAAYDKSLPLLDAPKPSEKKPQRARRKANAALIAGAVAVLALAAGGAWYFLEHRPAASSSQRAPEKGQAGAQVAEMLAPYLGRLQGASIGETRDLGLTLAMAENETVGTCRGMPAGMVFALQVGAATPKVELARANDELGICIYNVSGPASGIKVRAGTPEPGEPLYAIVRDAGAAPRAEQVSVGRGFADPKGHVFELKTGSALPNGTPIFDTQSRLVALVASPHEYGGGIVVALGAARIAASRPAGAPASAAAAEAAQATTSPVAPSRGAPRGTKVAEGFATLWKEAEDDDRRTTEVLDSVTKAHIGLPISYWTKWTGRDPKTPQPTHCRVTYGPNEEVVADYPQFATLHPSEGYWACGLTRFQVDLEELPKGLYTFHIIVNGVEVSQGSILMERRFFTPGVKIILVLVLGCALLIWVAGRKRR